MATNNNTSSVSAATSVMVEQVKIAAAKSNIVAYSKKLEQDIDSIDKVVDSLVDCWESTTATYYRDSVRAKIKDIKNEQTTLYNNLNKYFASILQKFEAAEKAVTKNADLFK